MATVKIVGGLGNQMFQYAYAKTLQQKGYDINIEVSAYKRYKLHGGYQLDKYNISLPAVNKQYYLVKVLNKLGFGVSGIIKEESFLFDKKLFNISDNHFIEGYFQSEKYFLHIRDELIKDFIIKGDMSQYTKYIESLILSEEITVSLHVRRGDYISDISSNAIHGTCDLEYYRKSIELVNDKFKDIKYFIFSDDIDWVEVNLKIDNAVYINSIDKRIPHEDIYLMSLCNHNIIANSSFSWWGAWLNSNSKKLVIAPQKWFRDKKMDIQSKDIVPTSWIKV